MKKLGIALAALGGILLLAGIVLGFTPISTDDYYSNDTVSCGSTFIPSADAAESADGKAAINRDLNGVRRSLGLPPEIAPQTNFVGGCDDARGARSAPAYLLIGLGVVSLIGGLILTTRTQITQPAA